MSSSLLSLTLLVVTTLTILVLLLPSSSSSTSFISAVDISISLTGSSGSSSEVTMESMWLGENITFTISGEATYNWSSSLSMSCFISAVDNRNSTEDEGCMADGICTNQTDIVNSSSSFSWVQGLTTTSVILHLNRALFFGYRHKDGVANNDSLRFNFSDSMGCFSGSPTGLPLEVSIPIRGFSASSITSAVSEASTELDIRLQSNTIIFSILYSSFLSENAFSFSLPTGITGSWSATTFPTIRAIYTLNQNSNYNISDTANIQVSFYSASTDETVLRNSYYSGAKVPTPSGFTFPIEPIVGPRTPCVISGEDNIYEADLRADTVPLIYVTFQNTEEDQFIENWDTAQQNAFISLARLPSRLQVAVSAVNKTVLALQFSVTGNASTYELDTNELITMRVPNDQLLSNEVGCGTFVVNVKASPGVITGKEFITKTEVQVMTESILLHFYLKHDEFITTTTTPASVDTNVVQAESGTVPVDAERSGFDVVMVNRVVVTIVNTTYATVLIPSSVDYNIPTKVTEMINISFPASALRSGIQPIMRANNTVNITYVDVVCTATFRSTGVRTISSEYVWDYGAELVFHLTGDKWTPGAELIWNRNHPRIRGLVLANNASIEGYSYENLVNAYAPVELFNYSTVNITSRVSSLRMIPLRGLVQQFDESVAISQLLSLVRGRPVIDEPSFKIFAVKPSSIEMTFSGVTDYKNGIRESELRQGFTLFLNTSYQVFPLATLDRGYELFTGTTSLTNILPRCKSGRGGNSTKEWWKYNVTCGPELFNDYDITQNERINILVPNSFYFGSIKPAKVYSTFFDIIADKNVGCFFATDEIRITERDVRSGNIRLDFLVQATDDFKSKTVLDTLPINDAIWNEYSLRGLPLGMKFGNTLRSDLVSFGLLKNETYDISKPDLVRITLNRHFFASGESCTSNLNFSVQISPGFGNVTFHNDTSAIQSDDIKTKPIYFSIYFTEEQLANWVYVNNSFDVKIYGVSKTGSSNPLGTNGMVANFGWAARVTRFISPTTPAPPTTTMTTVTGTTTPSPGSSSSSAAVSYPWHRFDGMLPAQPEYRISGDEDIVFEIPSNVVESGVSPVLESNRIPVKPAASGVSVAFADASGSFNETIVDESDPIFTVNESLIYNGGLEIHLTLLEDMWKDNKTSFQMMRSKVIRSHEDGTPLSPFIDTGNLNNIFNLSQFVLTSNNTLRITTGADPTYNAMKNELFTLLFEATSTVTGFAPRRGNVTWRVVPEKPYVTATGTGLFIGSTDFIKGDGAYIDITLHNDNFNVSEFAQAKLCQFMNSTETACSTKITTTNFREARLEFLPQSNTVVERNSTFPIRIPAAAIFSKNTLNAINVFVYLQRGIAKINLPGSPLTVGESVIRKGQLPPFMIFLEGDVFVSQLSEISTAMATAVACSDPSADDGGNDGGGSGSAAGENNNNNNNNNQQGGAVIDRVFGFCGRSQYLFASKKVTLINSQTATVEMQPDEDFDVAKIQRVNITLAARGVVSGLVPLGHLVLTVLPEKGLYSFATSRSVVTTADVARDPDFSVDIIFSLISERFIADPTSILVESATSSQSLAAEANGFARHKLSMFMKVQVSANSRVAKLTMVGNKDFSLLRAETISFFVNRLAVVSGIDPEASNPSQSRTITVEMSGGELTLLTPTTVSSDVFSSGLFNISISSTTGWDVFAVGRSLLSANTLSQVMISDRSAAVEPSGFSALRQQLLPDESLENTNTLSLLFKAAPTYKLNQDETITLTIPGAWTANGNRPFPSSFSITVSHFTTKELSVGSLYFYIPANVPLSVFVPALAAYAGMAPELVRVLSSSIHPRGNGRFRVVSILFNDMSSRPAKQAADFVRTSDPNLIRATLNVTAVLTPEEVSSLSSTELDERLGIRAAVIYQERTRTSWWVWVAVTFMLLLAIGGYFLYRRTRKRFLNLNASAVKTFQMGTSSASSSSGGKNKGGGGLFGGSNAIREVDNNSGSDHNENPLLAWQEEEEEEEMLAGLFQRYGNTNGQQQGQGLFVNSGIMVSGLNTASSTVHPSTKTSSATSKMSQHDVDNMLGVSRNNQVFSNSKTVRKNHHHNNSNKNDNDNEDYLLQNNRSLRFLGDERGPNVADEFEVNVGQQAPSLSSRVKAFQNKKVDVDETLAARQPAHVFGVERGASSLHQRNRNNNHSSSGFENVDDAETLLLQGGPPKIRAGHYDEDFVAPEDRYNDQLDGLSVFPPGESMGKRPLSNWRKLKMQEIQKKDPLQQGLI